MKAPDALGVGPARRRRPKLRNVVRMIISAKRFDTGRKAHIQAASEPRLGQGFLELNFHDVSDLRGGLIDFCTELLLNAGITSYLAPSQLARLRSMSAPDAVEQMLFKLSDKSQMSLQREVYNFIAQTPALRPHLRFARNSQASSTTPRPATHKPLLPTASGCVGRDTEANELITALVPPEPTRYATQCALLSGPGGMGKTTLAVHVVKSPEIAKRYTVYWIDCEVATSRAKLLNSLLSTLATNPPPAEDATFLFPPGSLSEKFIPCLDRLDGVKTLLCLDNLETLTNSQKDDLDELLPALIEKTSLLITQRSQLPPYTGRPWVRHSSLRGLDRNGSLEVFALHAGTDVAAFENEDGMDELLKMIDGYPLALHILGRRAAGGESVDDLKHFWNVEAARRAGAKDNRRSSIDFSIRLSLQSPIMQQNPFSLQLLLAATRLPASIDCGVKYLGQLTIRGLPRSLGNSVCGGFEKTSEPWRNLRQTGLATTAESNPSLLEIMAPFRAYLSEMEGVTDYTAEAVQKWLDEIKELVAVVAPYDEIDAPSTYKETFEKYPDALEQVSKALDARATLERLVGNPAAAKRAEAMKAGWEAEAAVVQADWPKVAETRSKAAAIWQSVDGENDNDALRHLALSADAASLAAEASGDYEGANERRQTAIEAWEKMGSTRDANWQRACILNNKTRMTSDDLEAAGYCEEAANLWKDIGEKDSETWMRARTGAYKASEAENRDLLEAVKYLKESAAAWREVNEDKCALMQEARIADFEGRIKEAAGHLESAVKDYEKEAKLYASAGQVSAAEDARNMAFSAQAMMAAWANDLPKALAFARETRSHYGTPDGDEAPRDAQLAQDAKDLDQLFEEALEAEVTSKWLVAAQKYRSAAEVEERCPEPWQQTRLIATCYRRAAICESKRNSLRVLVTTSISQVLGSRTGAAAVTALFTLLITKLPWFLRFLIARRGPVAGSLIAPPAKRRL